MGYLLAAGITAIVVLPLGFVCGFAVFRRSERWCPGCGSLITPTHCPHHQVAGAGFALAEGRRG